MNLENLNFKFFKLLFVKNYKRLTKSSMIFAGIYYCIGSDVFQKIDLNKIDPSFHTTLLIKILVAYFVIKFVFYTLVDYILRWVFHNHFREKILESKRNFSQNSSFSDKRDLSIFFKIIAELIFKYAVKLGLITSKDLKDPITFKEGEKEEAFNYVLNDLYSFIALVIHTLITCIVVFKFYSLWFILIRLLVLLFSLGVTFVLVYILLHLDRLELIRKELLKRSKELM